MNLSTQEIENVAKLEPLKRYEYFVKKIADFEELWTIVNKTGDIALSDVEENILISFWTAEPFIKSNLNGGWENCTPFKLSLDDLEETIIPLITKNNYLVNVFPVNGKSGFIVSLNEFIRDLNEELEKYE